MVFLFLATATAPDNARDQALDWRGDQLSIFGTEDDTGTVLVWRVAFEDPAAASRFATTARGVVPTNQVLVEDTRVVMALAEPATDLAWVLAPAD